MRQFSIPDLYILFDLDKTSLQCTARSIGIKGRVVSTLRTKFSLCLGHKTKGGNRQVTQSHPPPPLTSFFVYFIPQYSRFLEMYAFETTILALLSWRTPFVHNMYIVNSAYIVYIVHMDSQLCDNV